MDWLWPLYEQYVRKALDNQDPCAGQEALKESFLATLAESTATLYVMEPVGDTIKFKGLGRWKLHEVPELLGDPHQFISQLCGGGKFKINFHHRDNFVATHNFRTYGDPLWQDKEEINFAD